jgi:SAM-dependent methyltransferase
LPTTPDCEGDHPRLRLASESADGWNEQREVDDVISADLRAFVRANLPEPPARVLEIGAGDGSLARALRAGGYDVLAIDPASSSDDVSAVALADLDEPSGSFAAAVAIVSLHHVDPLEDSCRSLGELVEPGGRLVIDEFDVATFDLEAAEWWLEQRRALGEPQSKTAEELVEEHRQHLHPLQRILDGLEPHFELSHPVRGPWLHRWNLPESLRAVEAEAIARGDLVATGARLVGRRR